MGRSKYTVKKFLQKYPICCFCGGSTPATSIDHVPARAFFIDRKHPVGMEFPACSTCQNSTTDAEDVARLVTIFQGTSYNPSMIGFFDRNNDSLIRGVVQRKPELIDTGYSIGGNPIIRLGEEVQNKIVECQRKISLALYYRITGRILRPDQCMALTFLTFDKALIIDEQLALLDSVPTDEWSNDLEILAQFRYKWRNFSGGQEGLLLYLGTFIHGLVCFTLFLESEKFAVGDFRKTLKGPLGVLIPNA